ncbi:hypothetical protein AKO1_009970 [Acrasis kona]|uniref:Uncharacterized protein n=1 Tax=Acrasis kona TaxID=1008807 RepID=A0AAW2ZQH5_9EUKA
MSAIFLMNVAKLDLAQKICDTLVAVVNNEKTSDGRIRSAYSTLQPISREFLPTQYTTYTSNAVDPSISTRDQAYTIIALTRMYVHTGMYKYLKAAIKIGTFIKNYQASIKGWQGYNGGFSQDSRGNDVQLNYRTTGHNCAVYAAANMLKGITKDNSWDELMEKSSKFISNMFDSGVGAYRLHTEDNSDSWSADSPLSAVTQSQKILTGLDEGDSRHSQMAYFILQNLATQSESYYGIVYAKGGHGIHTESMAMTSMAFYAHAAAIAESNPALSETLKKQADTWMETLLKIQSEARNGDSQGLVASPDADGALSWAGNEFTGAAFRAFPLLNTAATAWTGLALSYIQNGDLYANPFASYWKKSALSYYSSSVMGTNDPGIVNVDISWRKVNNGALALSILFAMLLLGFLVALCALNYKIHKRNKEVKGMFEVKKINFTKIATETPQSPMNNTSPLGSTSPVSGAAAYGSPLTPQTPVSQQQNSFLLRSISPVAE